MNHKEFKQKLLKGSKFRKEYYKKDLAFEIAHMLIEARIIKGITQEKLAKLLKTKQPSIARVESGDSLPSLNFLEKIANALDTTLRISFDLRSETADWNVLQQAEEVVGGAAATLSSDQKTKNSDSKVLRNILS